MAPRRRPALNPRTGKPYGPDFPDITLTDIVGAQKLLLDSLGVRHLVAVAGPSFGGYQAFQWAVTYPSFVTGVVPVVTAPKGSGGDAAVKALQDRFATDPSWNGGWHYDRGGIVPTLVRQRIETLERYGQNEALARTIADPVARAARLEQLAETWARQFDPNSMVTLRKAAVSYDAERDFSRIRARVLYVLSRTDKLFPPSIAPGRDGQAPESRRGGAVLRDRHRARPLGERPGVGEVGARAEGLPGEARAVDLSDSAAPSPAFPRERTWLLPALHAAQRTDGWLSPDALERIAAHLRVPKSEVWAVASHYPEFRLARPGRRIVRVCTGVSCRARGGQDLVGACERALGIAAGRTTADGAVTLEEMDCAFACSVAPVVEVDHAYRGRVAPGDIDALLSAPVRAGHREEAPAAVAPASGSPVSRAPVSGSPAQRLAALAGDAGARSTGARLIVGVGACSLAVGAGETLAALRAEVARRGLSFAVVAAGCNGMCWAAPTVTVAREGQSPASPAP